MFVQQKADVLLKWLDPRFATPQPTPMALRWAQNTSAVIGKGQLGSALMGPLQIQCFF